MVDSQPATLGNTGVFSCGAQIFRVHGACREVHSQPFKLKLVGGFSPTQLNKYACSSNWRHLPIPDRNGDNFFKNLWGATALEKRNHPKLRYPRYHHCLEAAMHSSKAKAVCKLLSSPDTGGQWRKHPTEKNQRKHPIRSMGNGRFSNMNGWFLWYIQHEWLIFMGSISY